MNGASAMDDVQNPAILPSHGMPHETERPALPRYKSSPAFQSPIRHRRRAPLTPRQVKTNLNSRSEYSNSSDDGQWQHRINQYVIKQEIGRGSFGAVHLAVDQHGVEYAVKEFSKSRLRKRAQSHILRQTPGKARRAGHLGEGTRFNFPMRGRSPAAIHREAEDGNPLYLIQEEIAIMKKLNHPNLVALYEVLDDPGEDSLYMVLEMCKKGVVMRVGVDTPADPYDEETCRHFFRDLILGIEYLHAQGVVHRDIKPDNCLLTHDDVLKVVDFGVSEMFEKASEMLTAKSAGSPAFLPPELCVANHGDISGRAADIWSMGVTLYCLRYGRIPFGKSSVLELYRAIREDEVSYDPDSHPTFLDLMRRILEKDPAKRIKMDELREHPWVTRSGADPLLSAEENIADLVEPPTEEEMQGAITRNLRYLLFVMRAVKKFKRVISRRDSTDHPQQIFDQEERLFQPPLSMSPPHRGSGSRRKTRSVDSYDRHDGGGAMASLREHGPETSGAFRQDGLRLRMARPPHDHDVAMGDLPTSGLSNEPALGRGSQIAGKGQAHDPREDEPLILDVGPGSPDEGQSHVISESPTGTEMNVYETAYREEVERIRRTHGHSATIYLTRRIEHGAGTGRDDGAVNRSGPGDRPKIKWGSVLDMTKATRSMLPTMMGASSSEDDVR